MFKTSAFARLRENEREVRKECIILATMKLLEEKSFYEIGMRDIASEAGVSPASIYRYFPTRDDIFLGAIIQDINQIKKQLEKRLEKEASIDDLAEVVIDYFIDNITPFQMISHFMISSQIKQKTLKKFNAVRLYFLKIFGEAIKKARDSDNTPFFTDAFFASLAGIIMIFRNYPERSLKERRENIHKLAFLIMREGDRLDLLKNGLTKNAVSINYKLHI